MKADTFKMMAINSAKSLILINNDTQKTEIDESPNFDDDLLAGRFLMW